jgi:hypothetical protein
MAIGRIGNEETKQVEVAAFMPNPKITYASSLHIAHTDFLGSIPSATHFPPKARLPSAPLISGIAASIGSKQVANELVANGFPNSVFWHLRGAALIRTSRTPHFIPLCDSEEGAH